MYASGIPFNGNTVNERSLGGSESAAYYVAKELAKRGHRVSVFTESEDQGTFDGVQYLWVGPKDQRSPLGANWHFFCENTPHDVCLMQRVPFGFHYTYQSKVNLLWLHDIALRRNNDSFMSGQWQMSRLLPVSNWFKNQIAETWLVDRERISPIHNGVDYSLFDLLFAPGTWIGKSRHAGNDHGSVEGQSAAHQAQGVRLRSPGTRTARVLQHAL
jgi:hypothetical protein